MSNVEAERSYLDYIGCIRRQYIQHNGEHTDLLDQTMHQLCVDETSSRTRLSLTNIMVARGPAKTRVKSTTFIPARGLLSAKVDDRRDTVAAYCSLTHVDARCRVVRVSISILSGMKGKTVVNGIVQRRLSQIRHVHICCSGD